MHEGSTDHVGATLGIRTSNLYLLSDVKKSPRHYLCATVRYRVWMSSSGLRMRLQKSLRAALQWTDEDETPGTQEK
ncbi:hypothetical protein COCON_G00229670 [Conger conger]|uniref:Uncharacterized protein n=1 Tax=Conger conger TaxID=82655 RepID=A0A9Q1HMY7_CONCO|nr:hypothetical protein COCON_G00229670 [Conger conger]